MKRSYLSPVQNHLSRQPQIITPNLLRRKIPVVRPRRAYPAAIETGWSIR